MQISRTLWKSVNEDFCLDCEFSGLPRPGLSMFEYIFVYVLYMQMLMLWSAAVCFYSEMGQAGDRKEPVSASVAMIHSIPELIVSEEVSSVIHITCNTGIVKITEY